MKSGRLIFWRLVVIAIALGLWWVVDGRLLPDFVTSNPAKVADRLYQMFSTGSVWPDLFVTMRELVLGYAIGVMAGLIVGIVLGTVRPLGRVLEPLISALNSVPHIALAPLFLILLGLGIWSKVAIAALIVGFVMYNAVYAGMKILPERLMETTRLIGGKPVDILRWVVIPSLASPIMAGLKAGVPFSIIGVVVGEFIASDNGLGYYVRNAGEDYDAAGLWAGLVLLVVLVIALSGLLSAVERFVFQWRDAG
jgi:NitT/TauT family transport system permease protein